MKNKLKAFFRFLFRVDVLNRIIVFISIGFFVVIPSITLYYLNESNFSLTDVVPCLMILGIVVGTGLFCLYKPVRTTWFYFLEVLFVLAVYSDYFLNVTVNDLVDTYNLAGIFGVEVSYCVVGLLINIVFFIKSISRYRKSKLAYDEHTNADSPYDFLNGAETNKEIERTVDRIIPDDRTRQRISAIRSVKLSRTLRVASLFVYLIVGVVTLIQIKADHTSLIYYPTMTGLLILPVLLVVSIFLPRDFKYIYYYNGTFFLFLMILCANNSALKPLWIIVGLVFFVVSLLVTLITEGRTWTGANPDRGS
jgi:hypothetical protein